MFKLHTITVISQASKVMLKILQVRLQQFIYQEIQDVQAEFRKGRGTRDEIANICWIIKKKKENTRKTSTSAFLTTPKPLWITTICGKFLKRWEYQTTLPASWEICVQVKKQQLEPDMKQEDWFQIGNGVDQGCVLSPCLFNLYVEYIMWNAKMNIAQAGIKIAGRNINKLRYTDDTILKAESKEELKSLWMKVKEESAEVGLKLNIQKTKIMVSGPITSWQIDGESRKQWQTLISVCQQMVSAAMKLKDICSLEEELWPN